jgi:hypothetical protein
MLKESTRIDFMAKPESESERLNEEYSGCEYSKHTV